MWNFLANGMGGVNWAGLPLAVEFFGVRDVEALIAAMLVIKAHKAPKDAEATEE